MSENKNKGAKAPSETGTASPQVIERIVEVEKKEEFPSTDFLVAKKVTVKYIVKENDYIKDPKHVGYGGLFVGTSIAIPPPLMDNGKMKNLLTKKEKEGLEFLLGKNLSIYGDFWKTAYQKGSIFPIYLGKDDVTLDLSNPMDFIVWKVLKASNLVANNLNEIKHRATNRFVLIEEGDEVRKKKEEVGSTVLAYKLYVKYEEDKDVLRYILRQMGRYTSPNQKIDFLQVETAKLIQARPSDFLMYASDEFLTSKVLLEKCVEKSVINQVENKFYTKENQPISEGDTPTMDVASRYLSSPLGQEMRLVLEAKLKQVS